MELTGKQIHKIRTEELHVSLDQLAELTDTTKPTLIRYEKEKSRPKKWFIEKLEQIRRSPVVIQIRRFTRERRKRRELIEARAGRSQREIAQILGIDFTRLSQWENGQPVPEKWIQKLSQFYQMAKEKLFPDIFAQKENRFAEAA